MAVLKKESEASQALIETAGDNQFAQFDPSSTVFQLVFEESTAHSTDFSRESAHILASRKNTLIRPSVSFLCSQRSSGRNIPFFDGCINFVGDDAWCVNFQVRKRSPSIWRNGEQPRCNDDHGRWSLSFIIDCPRVTSGWEECTLTYVLLSLTPMDSWEYVDANCFEWLLLWLIDRSINSCSFFSPPLSLSFSHLLLFVFIPRILRFVVAYFYIRLFLTHFSFLADQHVSCEQ